jgi:hypothetical protein
MKEVYVHTLRYHHYGPGNRRSRIMFPMSYGPFKDEESAWEWVRRSGITSATKLMGVPAKENIEIPHHHLLSIRKDRKFSGSLNVQMQPNVGD